jgi:hypothetical protein
VSPDEPAHSTAAVASIAIAAAADAACKEDMQGVRAMEEAAPSNALNSELELQLLPIATPERESSRNPSHTHTRKHTHHKKVTTPTLVSIIYNEKYGNFLKFGSARVATS